MWFDGAKFRLEKPLVQHIHACKCSCGLYKLVVISHRWRPHPRRKGCRDLLCRRCRAWEAVCGWCRVAVEGVVGQARGRKGHGAACVAATTKCYLAVVLEVGMVQVGGARAVRPCVVLATVCHLLVLLLLLKLARKLGQALLVLWENGVDGEVNVAVWSNAAELLRDVVDDGLAAVVEIRLAKVPLLAIADHRVELVHGGDEGKLSVLQDLSVSAKQRVSRSAFQVIGGVQLAYPRGNCLNSVFFLVPAVHTRPSSLHLLHGNSPSH